MAKLEDVKIDFISLVDKAANKKRFAIVKSEDGKIETETSIINKNEEKKLVTCIVYEPDEVDTHGDYMTNDSIEKAAHHFMINGIGADVQHDNKKANVDIVESWVTKSDTTINDQLIKKGTWVATAKVNDEMIWKAIKDGKLNGFSMGGTAKKINKSEGNMEEIKKMLEEMIAKNANSETIAKFTAKLAELEGRIEKAAPGETPEEKTKREADAKAMEDMKGTVKKMEEKIEKMENIAPTQEVSIEKAETDFSETIRKANLTTGAAIVPKPLSNQMVKDMEEIAPFYKDANKISATGTTIRVPVRKPNSRSSAKNKAEGAETTNGDTNFSEVEISKSVIQSIIPITDELRRDTNFNIAGLVREYGTEDIAVKIAQDTYNGVIAATQKIEGFSKNAAFAGKAVMQKVLGKFTWDELATLKSEVKPQYYAGAKWYVSKAAMLVMKTMKDTQDRPLWIESTRVGQPATFDGHPVVLCWQMDIEFPVLFANFKKLFTYFVDYQMESEINRMARQGYTDEILRARLGGRVTNIEAGIMMKKKA